MKMNRRFILSASFALFLGGGTGLSNASARTAQEILSDAVLHCDASDIGSLTFNIVTENGAAVTNVTKWANLGAGGEAYDANAQTGATAQSGQTWEPPRYADGRIDFGPKQTPRDMAFREISGIRTVFWVVDIVQDPSAFLLGHTSTFHFHRGTKGEYAHTHQSALSQYGAFWDCGGRVDNPKQTPIPTGQRVISFLANSSKEGLKADSLTCDRNGGSSKEKRYGGRKLAEVAIFTNRLSDAERQTVERHLIEKWSTEAVKTWAGGDGLWSAAAQWEPEGWADAAETFFPADGGGTVGADTNVAVKSLFFKGDYTVTNAGGTIALGGSVTVAAGKAAAILAPVSGTLDKRGAGLLVLDPGTNAAAGPSSYSFSGPAAVRDGAVAAPVTLAADAELTLTNATLQAGVSGGGALFLGGTNTLGEGASLSGLSSLTFGAAGLTRIAGTVSLGCPDMVEAGEGSALAVEAGGALSYDLECAEDIPLFTLLDGTVTITDCEMAVEDIKAEEKFPVAEIADGLDIDIGKFSGTVVSTTGVTLPAVFTIEDGVVMLHADSADFERPLVWAPGGGAVSEGTWIAGDEGETPWTTGEPAAPASFRDGDHVTFGTIGEGGNLSIVNVSGTVAPGAVAFAAEAGGTAYLFRPAEGAAIAKVEADGAVTVNGLVTNRVAWALPGLTLAAGARFVQAAPGDFSVPAAIGPGAALVLAPDALAAQTLSGALSGAGDIVKDGGGETAVTGPIGSSGTLAVRAGRLVIKAENRSVAAAAESPVTVGPGASIRFEGKNGEKNRMPDNGRLLCDGGTAELCGKDPFNDAAAPDFVMENGARLVADCSVDGGRLALRSVRLDASDVLIRGAARADGYTALSVASLSAAGACRIAYDDGASSDNYIVFPGETNGTILVEEGGALEFAAGLDSPAVKTGAGTLAAGQGAYFNDDLIIREGTLKILADADSGDELFCEVKMKKGTRIDVRDRTDAYAWGEGLTVGKNVTVEVDVAGRTVRTGDEIFTWDVEPAGQFRLAGAPGFSVRKTDSALEVVASVGTVVIIR